MNDYQKLAVFILLFFLFVPLLILWTAKTAEAYYDEDLQKDIPFVISDQMKNCTITKHGPHKFHTGIKGTFEEAFGDIPSYNRGSCYTASTWSMVQGITPEARPVKKDAHRKQLDRENKIFQPGPKQASKIEEAMELLKSLGFTISLNK